jgi:Carboxypeptidase regulatory-like domain/TonB dependent receptor
MRDAADPSPDSVIDVPPKNSLVAKMCFRRFLCVLFVTFAATRIAAQPAMDYTLEGIIRDSTGAVMVAVDVTLTSSAGSNRRTAVTDEAGRFAFHGLPSDAYLVTASAAGFAEAAQTVLIKDEHVASVELVLQLAAVAEHVQVSTEVQLSGSSGLTAMTLTGAALEALPDDPGGLMQRVYEMAGATDVSALTVTVDGFRQGFWLPPKQAIQAIRISSNWFAPEFAEPGQARIEIITKPGSTTVHGDVTANFNDEAMNARNALAAKDPSGQMREVTGYFSGPVIPRRLSLVVYRGFWTQQLNRVINATVLDGGYRAAPHLDTISEPRRVDSLWIGTTYQVAPAHTLAVSFSGTTDRAQNLGLDSGLDLPERAYQRTATDRALRATLTSVASTRLFNELRLQANPYQSMTRADSSAPAVIVFDAFNAGGNQEALLTGSRHLDMALRESFTLFVPRHTVKAGFDARSTARRYTDASNAGGVFTFAADFERDAAGVPLKSANGDRSVISPLESYRRTLLNLPGYGPSQFWMTVGDPEVRFRDTSVAAFAQDDWSLTPRVTLSYGLRSDWQSASTSSQLGARAGLAIALDSARKNVILAGAGSFYQHIEPELTLDLMRFDGRHQKQVRIDHPSFFATVPADIVSSAASVPTSYVTDGALRTPQILISSVSYSRELTAKTFATLKYSHQRGTDLLRTRIVNAGELAGQVLQYESTGQLQRHELTSGLRWNARDDAGFSANYSYVHGRSDTDGRATLPADNAHLDQEFGPTAADRAHTANISAYFTVPGELSISPYVTAASGRVFNITTGFDNNGDGVFADRPAVVAPETAGAIATKYGSLLANPTPGTPTIGRNAGREPAAVRVDLRVSRAFRYRARASMVFAANVENVLNRANFEGVNGVVTSPVFGMPNRAEAARRVNLFASFNF